MKITPIEHKNVIIAKTKDKSNTSRRAFQWWNAKTDRELAEQLLSTAAFLKESQGYRQRQASIYARLYGNLPLNSFLGSNISKMDQMTGIPTDRPTFNIVQSVIDTKVARIAQSRPAPIFLTDNSDYKERRLAQQLNNFILGEFHQTKAYEKATILLRDAEVMGDGILKVYETDDHKVGIERVLCTELLVDANEGIYGEPRRMYQLKLVDRDVLMAQNPKFKDVIKVAENAFPDNSADSSKTISDLVMVVEGWSLRSSKNSKDGRHTIACTSGVILDEEYEKDRFPFVILHDSERLLGFWSQGAAERLMGNQIEINKLLHTISRSISLVGVPSVWIESGAKIAKSAFNNQVGNINTYTGTPPIFNTPQCVPAELYSQLQRLIDYGYQQEGVSAMQAASQKPAGLNSGEAIRSYDDISTDRMATLSRKYDNVFIDLAYLITDFARDIAIREGSYQTIYPNKNGTKQIDLPEMDILKDPFVIQCFNASSLPKDPAGRMQKITEMIASGMLSIKEGRRLLDYPDLDQVERLANASEERILQILDKIVEDGEYTSPDPFMDPQLATELCTQYYNLYTASRLEEDKTQMLRDFFTQVQTLVQAAQPPAPPMGPAGNGGAPQAPGAPAPTVIPPPQQAAVTSKQG